MMSDIGWLDRAPLRPSLAGHPHQLFILSADRAIQVRTAHAGLLYECWLEEPAA
jgi:hypothetical protein